MSDSYYYTSNGKRQGPVSFQMLRELATRAELKRDQKVWCPGMKEWQSASSIDKLFEDLPPDLEPEKPHTLPPLQTQSQPVTTAVGDQNSQNCPSLAKVSEINQAAESVRGAVTKTSGPRWSTIARVVGVAIATCSVIVFCGLVYVGAVGSAVETARDTCIWNLRNIDAAEQQYRLEHRLSVASTVTPEQILSLLPESQRHCPSGGTYTFGNRKRPSCSIPGHELPQ